MSDAIIIQAVYIGIGPFFVVESAAGDGEGSSGKAKKNIDGNGNVVLKTFGKSAMRGLRLDALALIRSVSLHLIPEYILCLTWCCVQIFANHENQRSWIIEEILSSLIKLSDIKQKAGQFRYIYHTCQLFSNTHHLCNLPASEMGGQLELYQHFSFNLYRHRHMMYAN